MRKPQSPCEGCTDRTAVCHADCRFYRWYEREQEGYRHPENFSTGMSEQNKQ